MLRRFAISTLAPMALFAAPLRFRPQEIQSNFGVVYAVSIADMNKDGKPDIVAINPTQVVWFENPTWKKHVVLEGVSKKDNVCFGTNDLDGDGIPEIALGADWQPSNTNSAGTLQWLARDRANPAGPWKHFPLGEEPTLHRMRWGDVDGDGKNELIVAPLHGRGTKGPDWEGQGARILVYWPPAKPETEPWRIEVADSSLHIVHNLIVVNGEIWTASKEGVYALKRDLGGKWTKRKVAAGAPGEIKLGSVNRIRHLATVEPWHGNKVVIYEEPTESLDSQSGTKVNPAVIAARCGSARKSRPESIKPTRSVGLTSMAMAPTRSPSAGATIRTASPSTSAPPMASGRKQRWTAASQQRILSSRISTQMGNPKSSQWGRSTANVRIYWNETEPSGSATKSRAAFPTTPPWPPTSPVTASPTSSPTTTRTAKRVSTSRRTGSPWFFTKASTQFTRP
jgi:hypothetical protein